MSTKGSRKPRASTAKNVPAEPDHSIVSDTEENEVEVERNILGFPVVAIGASAGGLEALQDFFDNMVAQPEAAFVVIQHLSPDHKSFMRDLLRHHTSLPIDYAEEDLPVAINHIYLIPPKMNMTIFNGKLHLEEIIGHTLNLPIDLFFRSLAEDQQSNSVAIILSGTGSDGTLGIRAIKEKGGIALVQSARDAKFDGMPKSALSTECIDLVKPAKELAKELSTFLQHPLFAHTEQEQEALMQNQKLYKQVLAILNEAKNVDFTPYKQTTIIRRLEKRISINRLSSLAEYVKYLEKSPTEIETLFNDVLIGVTRFFRDTESFETLENHYLPMLFEKQSDRVEIRIWIAGCSTGEEAYSIAIIIREYLLVNRILADVKIFATDIDDKSLKYATIGFYPGNITADVPPKYLSKYFTVHGNGYQVNPDIRRMIIFAAQNVIDNPPFFKLDLISCRNLLIYINPEAQQKVLSSFYAGLRPDGILFLGSSESLGKLADAFDVADSKAKIFTKRAGYKTSFVPQTPMPSPLHVNKPDFRRVITPPSFTQQSRQLLSILERINDIFLPPSVIVDSECELLYTIHDAGSMLRMASGIMTTNLLRMLPKDVSLIISSLIRRAESRDDIITAELTLNHKPLNVMCKRINPTGTETVFYYLAFNEIKPQEPVQSRRFSTTPANISGRYQERIDDLENVVMQQKESLQSAVEELETSNEELQSSNEELVASNEELQSSNEELQSVNEELYTVNTEHVRKLEEIAELNADYDNLLSNTQIGTLFLDSNLIIRKISTIASKITNILPSDIERPLYHLSLNTLYSGFLRDVEQVNETHKRIERELPYDGKFYFMRIVPYVVKKGEVCGIIISFVDLTESKISTRRHSKKIKPSKAAKKTKAEAAANDAVQPTPKKRVKRTK